MSVVGATVAAVAETGVAVAAETVAGVGNLVGVADSGVVAVTWRE